MATAKKKTAKEASAVFHNIIKASVSKPLPKNKRELQELGKMYADQLTKANEIVKELSKSSNPDMDKDLLEKLKFYFVQIDMINAKFHEAINKY